MKNNKLFACLISLIALVLFPMTATAQSDPVLSLSLNKDFGYSGFGPDIQGVFSLRAKGPENLSRVVFFIDGQTMGEAITPPFRLQFDTGSYPIGQHIFTAVGYTSDGKELTSNSLTREFVSAGQGFEGALSILLPVFGLVIVAAVLAWGIPTLFLRKKTVNLPSGAVRNYSPLGGAICPKCGRPFAIHLYGFNIAIGKYDRCPYCGKWSVVHRADPRTLRAAEEAELEEIEAAATPETSPEDKLRKDLENSRYQDF